MKTTQYISSYLAIHPIATATQCGWRHRLRNRIVVLWRSRPYLSKRTAIGVVVWLVIFGLGLHAFSTDRALPRKGSVLAASSESKTVSSAAVTASTTLPAGPTGQLLPPGTLAPAYTYRNSYARGQCTWYVAGRRPVPSNWGNARNWYYAAQRAGWSTGLTPAVGAIAWTPSGFYGHVALVEGVDTSTGRVYIAEMNNPIPYRISHRWAPINDFKYIY